MTTDDVQSLVDDLAQRLQRSAAVDDPSLGLLAASRHFGDEDELRVTSVLNRSIPETVAARVFAAGIADWTEPGRVDIDTAGVAARLCVPVRCNRLLLGYLWLLDDEKSLTRHEIGAAVETAARVGVVLYRHLLLRERTKARQEVILRELVSSAVEVRAQAVEDLQSEQLVPDDAGWYQVVVAQGDPGAPVESAIDVALAAALEDGLRVTGLDDRAVTVTDRSRAWLLLARPAKPSGEQLRALGERITRRFRDLTGSGTRLVIGIGDPVDELLSIRDSYRQAVLAARAATLVSTIGDTASWGNLGPYEILLSMPPETVARATAVPALAALESADSHQILLETLELFFDNAGDVRRTAELMHVHRATLYHRLKRIEEVTGCRLDRGDDRLLLHLALKLRRLAAAHRDRRGE